MPWLKEAGCQVVGVAGIPSLRQSDALSFQGPCGEQFLVLAIFRQG